MKKLHYSAICATLLIFSGVFFFSINRSVSQTYDSAMCDKYNGRSIDVPEVDSETTCESACAPEKMYWYSHVDGVCCCANYCPAGKTCIPNPFGRVETSRSIPRLIGNAVHGLLGVIGTLALVMFLYGGFLWLTAFGEEEKVKKGWDTMIWGGLGLGTIFGSYVVVSFILGVILSPGITSPSTASSVTTSAPSGAPPPTPTCDEEGGSCIGHSGLAIRSDGITGICTQTYEASCPGDQMCCAKIDWGSASPPTEPPPAPENVICRHKWGLLYVPVPADKPCPPDYFRVSPPAETPPAATSTPPVEIPTPFCRYGGVGGTLVAVPIDKPCPDGYSRVNEPPAAPPTPPVEAPPVVPPAPPVSNPPGDTATNDKQSPRNGLFSSSIKNKEEFPNITLVPVLKNGRALSAADAAQGSIFSDVQSHVGHELPIGFSETKFHEEIHAINAEMRGGQVVIMGYDPITGEASGILIGGDKTKQGIYLGEGQGVIVQATQKISMKDVNNYLSAEIQKKDFKYSYVAQYMDDSKSYDNYHHPTVLLDEFSAYLAQDKFVVERYQRGAYDKDGLLIEHGIKRVFNNTNSVNFIPLSLALGAAIEDNEQSYFTNESQFKDTLKYLIQESIKSNRVDDIPALGKRVHELFTDKLLELLRDETDPKTARLRKFAIDSFGPGWTKEYLGF